MNDLTGQKQLSRSFFRLSILTLITVIIWVAIITYQAFTKSRVGPEVKKEILPLTPTLDLDTMERIKERQVIPPENWSNLVVEQKTATAAAKP